MNDLQLLAINLTRRCNLACAHCYLDAEILRNGATDELSTDDVCCLLDQVAELSAGTMVVLTGGEPLIRRDLEQIIDHGAGRELAMVVGTNGMLLTDRRVHSLKQAGVLGLGISVDSLDPTQHDAFRGRIGAWSRTMAGIERCRSADLSFQIHFSVTDQNANELNAMIDFARSVGARVLNIFFLVCTGRGQSVSDITPQRYEEVLLQLIEAQQHTTDLIIRARCAPHFKRVAHQLYPDSQLNQISGRDGDGCIAGIHYCRIAPNGGVTACPYIEKEVGNIHQQSFSEIWQDAPDFQRLRVPHLNGKCGVCEYRELCGGCRARPLAAGRDLMDDDLSCTYSPKGGAVIVPLPDMQAGQVRWSPEAAQRLQRIPTFLRRLVKKRAEHYVAELGEQQVTAEHLSVLAARRFGNHRPHRVE